MQEKNYKTLTVDDFKKEIEKDLKLLSRLNLSGHTLKGINMSGIEFFGCKFCGAILSDSIIDNVNFFSSDLTDSSFENLKSQKIDFNDSKVTRTNFSNVFMPGGNFKYIKIVIFSNDDVSRGPIFRKANLSNANFFCSKIQGADFSYAILTQANLENCNLVSVNFHCADLTGASLINSRTLNPNFSGANLTNTKLNNLLFGNANFINAILEGANLLSSSFEIADFTNANFTNANLYQCNLSRAIIVGAKFDGALRASFSSDLSGIGYASKLFLSLLNRPDLSIDQKKQMLEIDDDNPHKPKISDFLKEKTADILKDKYTGKDEKKNFQDFLKKVIELEVELAPKIEQQPLINHQGEGSDLVEVKLEPQEPSAVADLRKRRRENGSPSSANQELISRDENPQRDEEILDAARILVSMRHNVRS